MQKSKRDITELMIMLGYTFNVSRFLERALTRTSAITEGIQRREVGDFQVLETLGDSMLGAIITDVLVEYYPHYTEGQLTNRKAALVNNFGPLAQIARELCLGDFLLMGRGEELQGVRSNVKVLSDTLEAVIGAIWKDSHDYNVLKEFVVRLWTPLGLLPSVTYQEFFKVAQKVLFEPQNAELHIKQFELFLSCVDKETVNGLLVDTSITINTRILSLVLSKKPDQEYLDSALIYSILSGSEEDVALLLHHGSNPNTVYDPDLELKGEGGFEWFSYHRYHSLSALQIAVIENNVPVVILLIKYGGDPNWNQGITIEKVRPAKNKEEAALELKELAHQSVRDTVEVALSDYGDELIDSVSSDISCAFFGESTAEMTVLEYIRKKQQQKPPTFNRRPNLQTALHVAFSDLDNHPSVELVQVLLNNGAKPNAQDYEGNTPLHILVSDEHASYFTKIISLLFDSGMDPNITNGPSS
jgi:dsRNA-specific ribonuclease/ankyrin repeat protein